MYSICLHTHLKYKVYDIHSHIYHTQVHENLFIDAGTGHQFPLPPAHTSSTHAPSSDHQSHAPSESHAPFPFAGVDAVFNHTNVWVCKQRSHTPVGTQQDTIVTQSTTLPTPDTTNAQETQEKPLEKPQETQEKPQERQPPPQGDENTEPVHQPPPAATQHASQIHPPPVLPPFTFHDSNHWDPLVPMPEHTHGPQVEAAAAVGIYASTSVGMDTRASSKSSNSDGKKTLRMLRLQQSMLCSFKVCVCVCVCVY